jgi:hypothetical protein
VVLPSVSVAEFCPLVFGPRVLAQVDIALELDDADRRAASSLPIERHIPDTRCGILRIAIPDGVDKMLLRSRVCANKSNEIVRVDGLVGKELDQDIC